MTSRIDVKQALQAVGVVLSFVAAIDLLILAAGVASGDHDAVSRWMVRHFESMIWLTIAESLGLTGTLTQVSAPSLKALARR